jgi:hypothetical protein
LELTTATTSECIFSGSNKLIEEKCCGGNACTDGETRMTGHHSAVLSRKKGISHPDPTAFHCLIYGKQLASEDMAVEHREVRLQAVQNINFSGTSAEN